MVLVMPRLVLVRRCVDFGFEGGAPTKNPTSSETFGRCSGWCFSISWGCHHPNWLSLNFHRGRYTSTTNQCWISWIVKNCKISHDFWRSPSHFPMVFPMFFSITRSSRDPTRTCLAPAGEPSGFMGISAVSFGRTMKIKGYTNLVSWFLLGIIW